MTNFEDMPGAEVAGIVTTAVFTVFTAAYEKLADERVKLDTADMSVAEIDRFKPAVEVVFTETMLATLAGILDMLLRDTETCMPIYDEQQWNQLYMTDKIASSPQPQDMMDMIKDTMRSLKNLPTTEG